MCLCVGKYLDERLRVHILLHLLDIKVAKRRIKADNATLTECVHTCNSLVEGEIGLQERFGHFYKKTS